MFCDKCFKNLDKENHAEWCPYYKDPLEGLKDIFGNDFAGTERQKQNVDEILRKAKEKV